MIRVLMVVPFFGGLREGNPDVVDLAVELQKTGHEVTVLTTRYKNEASYEEVQGVRIYRSQAILYLSKIDYGISLPFITLHRMIRKYNVDVVHGVMEFGMQTLSAALISSLLKKPFVLTIQGAATTFGAAHVDAMFSLFDQTVVRMFSFIPKRVIVLSKELSERARQIGIPYSKIRVVPSGIHCENEFNHKLFDHEAVRKEFELQDKIIVGFVGRLVRLKGLVYLLYALKNLEKEFPNLHLLIVGYGQEKSFIEKIAQKLNLNVTFTGRIKRREIPRVISAMDMFVNPSLTEGLPIAVMEAMAMRKPVVATNVGGTQDLVRDGENGFLVPPRDVSALSSAIKKLVQDADMRLKMGVAGRAIIERDFCFSTIVAKVDDVYKQAIY